MMRGTPVPFTVRGKLPFPTDMLRYDGCWPATSADAQEMEDSISRVERGKVRTINMLSHRYPTDGRWESFMWKVVQD